MNIGEEDAKDYQRIQGKMISTDLKDMVTTFTIMKNKTPILKRYVIRPEQS